MKSLKVRSSFWLRNWSEMVHLSPGSLCEPVTQMSVMSSQLKVKSQTFTLWLSLGERNGGWTDLFGYWEYINSYGLGEGSNRFGRITFDAVRSVEIPYPFLIIWLIIFMSPSPFMFWYLQLACWYKQVYIVFFNYIFFNNLVLLIWTKIC